MQEKNKFNKKTIAIISAVVLICLITPTTTYAGLAASIARSIFGFLAKLVLQLISLLVGFGATFLNTMLDIGFSGTYKQIAEAGWKTSRDISNMFFVLIMILIAFGTILRIEQYGAKKLLPKLIFIALLINFSLPLCYVFIDISNVAAKSFITSIGSGNEATIRERLLTSVKAGIMLIPIDCSEYSAGADRDKCEAQNETIKGLQDEQSWVDVIVSSVVACIFLGLSAFTLIAGAMMFVIRLIFLGILVILAPLAFMCYITPSLNKHWKEWWSSLLKWCFFAPIFTFFFWLAITTVDKISVISDMAKKPAIEGNFMSGFFATMANSIAYFLFIGLIMGGIIAAQKLGINGANVAMGLAQKAKKGATDWAKRKTLGAPSRLGAAAGGTVLQKVGARLKKTKLFAGLGERAKYAGDRLKTAPFTSKDMQAYKKFVESLTPEDRERRYNTTIDRQKRAVIAMVANEKGDQTKLDSAGKPKLSTATGVSMAKTLEGYGFKNLADNLIETRLDIADGLGKLNETIKKLEKQGKIQDISAAGLNDKTVRGLITQLDPTKMLDTLETLKTKSPYNETALKQSLQNITQNNSDKQTHFAYAAVTKDLSKLDTATTPGVGIAEFAREAAAHLKGIKNIPAGAVDKVAFGIPTAQLEETIRGIASISPAIAARVVQEIKLNTTAPYQNHLNKAAVSKSKYLDSLA